MPTNDLIRLAFDFMSALPAWPFVIVWGIWAWRLNIRTGKARRAAFERGQAKAAADRAEATSWSALTARFPTLAGGRK
jgi:hypothetical protein